MGLTHGCTVFNPQEPQDIASLLKKADQSMYRRKQPHSSQPWFFSLASPPLPTGCCASLVIGQNSTAAVEAACTAMQAHPVK